MWGRRARAAITARPVVFSHHKSVLRKPTFPDPRDPVPALQWAQGEVGPTRLQMVGAARQEPVEPALNDHSVAEQLVAQARAEAVSRADHQG